MSEANLLELTARQQLAITALLREPSLGKVAQVVGVTERTLYRWMHEPRFASVYQRARRQAFGQAVAQCQYYATLAVNTLARLTADAATPAHARVAAALGLMKFAREGIELEDLAERLARLEERSGGTPPDQVVMPVNPWTLDRDDPESDDDGLRGEMPLLPARRPKKPSRRVPKA